MSMYMHLALTSQLSVDPLQRTPSKKGVAGLCHWTEVRSVQGTFDCMVVVHGHNHGASVELRLVVCKCLPQFFAREQCVCSDVSFLVSGLSVALDCHVASEHSCQRHTLIFACM